MTASPPYEAIGTIDDREAWLAARQTGIGSSDAPATLGISPFMSAIECYAIKIGAQAPKPSTPRMKWGTIHEPNIIAAFEEETGRPCRRNKILIRSTRHPWALATLDATQDKHGDAGLLEVKSTTDPHGEWSSGIVPPHVIVQVQHQLFVTGYRWGSVAVLIDGWDFYWKDIERDDDFIERKLLPAEADFWRRVQERVPPAPDGTISAKHGLDLIYPSPVAGTVVPLPGEFVELDSRLVALKMEIKDAEAEKDRLEQELKAAIGEHEAGSLANGVVYTFKEQHRKGFVVEPASFRVLRRSKKGD